MAFSRSLLIKGIAGGLGTCTACAAGGIVIHQRENIFGRKGIDLNSLTDKQLIDKVGLDCKLSGDDIGSETKECSVKDNGKINVKRGDQKEEGVSFTNEGSPKLKVSRSTEGDYSKNLKFVVDSGDITLTKDGGTSLTISKLDQYETYGISEEGGKFYLIRKTEANREKERELGLLGKCELPATGDKDCTFNTEEIKKVKFDGVTDGVVLSSGEVTLKISKMNDTTTFPDGYRFTFTFPSEVTINSKSLKANTSYDFKIKKTTNSNALSLEKAWSDDNTFTKKAGLDCTTNTECSISTDTQKLNVRVGDKKKENITTLGTSGKIKMEKDQQGYNQGLKFSITTGDVTLTGGDGDSSISKLEELETYEITEEKGKYYLTKKSEKDEKIKTSLGLPTNCNLPSTSTDPSNCSLDSEKFQNINFDGKNTASSGEVTLKISKVTNTTDFPLGYRFTFTTTNNEATIATNNKIKVNIPTDFKIKKNASNPTSLSLEKAWTETKFSEKVGLTCTASSGNICCSKSSGGTAEKLNVKRGEAKKENITSLGEGGKIKVEKDQEGYNQGLKFTITTGDVDLTGGDASGTGGESLTKLEELETYEITEEGDKYYLTRKDEASKTIENLLALPSSCRLSSTSCSLNTQELQNIKFDGKDSGSPSGTATLTISTASDKTDFPLGYKFSLLSTSGDITIKTSTNIVKANISTDFKIKKDTSNPTNLSLEKAWTASSLGSKVGLQNCNAESSSNECSINGGTTINVKQDDKSDTSLTKNGSGGSSAKIKVEKDQVGYNQGFKFTISDASITLNGGTQSEEDKKIKSLDEYETYEIKEVGNSNWYLVRKDKAQVFIKKELNIGDFCTGNFPTSNAPNTCNYISDVSKLQNINFDNKESFSSNWPSSVKDIQLEINRDPSLPGGYKFTFNGCTGNSCSLPGSTNAEKDSSCGLIYKIKKGANGSICLEPKQKSAGSSSGGGSCTK